MSYSIGLRTFQTNPNAYFSLVEQTVWNFANGGTWSETDGVHTLTMGGSGTSGTLRFVSDTGENFIVAVGVHNFERWCDIIADLSNNQTGVVINPLYYTSGTPQTTQRTKQLSTCSVENTHGRNFELNYTVTTGNELEANIIIG